jgi:hypothetical protein
VAPEPEGSSPYSQETATGPYLSKLKAKLIFSLCHHFIVVIDKKKINKNCILSIEFKVCIKVI